MLAGPVISGAGHAALIALAVWGLPWLSPRERDAIRVTEVDFVTEAEFQAAVTAAAEAARAPEAPPEPAVAAVEATPPPTLPEVVRGPSAEAPPPEPLELPEDLPSLAPAFDPEAPLAMATPDFSPVTPRIVTVEPPTAVTQPQPRPVTRIAPDPAPPQQEPARPAEELVIAAAPTPEPAPETPEAAPEAPPEAAPEPVAEPSPVADLALMTSGRPAPRPARPTPAPAPTPAPSPQPDRQQDIQSAVAAAAAAAAAAAGATPPTEPTVTQPTPPSVTSLPVGPPLTGSERDGLRLAVQRCWNVPAGLRNAQELRVVIGAELSADGDIISSSIRLIEPDPAPDARFQQAYEAGRRALIRCAPYTSLPREKFAQWRNIEVVFNPEGMVSW
jgi:hypothetical protein